MAIYMCFSGFLFFLFFYFFLVGGGDGGGGGGGLFSFLSSTFYTSLSSFHLSLSLTIYMSLLIFLSASDSVHDAV